MIGKLGVFHGLGIIDAADCQHRRESASTFGKRKRLTVVAIEEKSRFRLVLVQAFEDFFHVVIWTYHGMVEQTLHR